jgi:hypothetical protein
MKKIWVSLFALASMAVFSLSCTKKDESPAAPPAMSNESTGNPAAAGAAPAADAVAPAGSMPSGAPAVNAAPNAAPAPGAPGAAPAMPPHK